MKTPTFRYDINALRAWAVISVIGFHFQIGGFANGFIGVDIFLVISGFLIGTQALQKLKVGNFLVGQFLQMRLRRIFPALYFLVLASVALGWQFSLPSEYLQQLRLAMSALAFVSNIAFSNDIGYFSAAAQTKPLLHTWSLSVEWQFYLCLPLILLAIKRLVKKEWQPKSAMVCLSGFAVASFIWCLWQSSENSASSFFSLTSRAWEFLVGCLIAGYEVFIGTASATPQPHNAKIRSALAVLGWAMLLVCVFVSMSETHWPGPITILPVCGAALIIATNAPINRSTLIENKLVQSLGDWSYSLYLWHWTLWVFLTAWLSLHGELVSPTHKVALLLTTLLASFFSFKWVEQPFRVNRDYWTPKRLVSFSFIGFFSLVSISAAIFAFQGVPQRLPPYIERAELARLVNTPRDECFRNAQSEKAVAQTFCEFGLLPQAAVPTAIVWGDSIANQYLEPLTQAAEIANFHGLIATQSGCRAFMDVPGAEFGVPEKCRQFNQSTLAFLRSAQSPKIVILARNWGAPEEITPLISTLLSLDKTVVLVLPSLRLDFDVPTKWIEMQYRAGEPIDNWSLPATEHLLQQELRSAIASAVILFKNNPKFIQVDTLPTVCDAGHCYLVRNGQVNFRDTLHISNLNASQYTPLFTKALRHAVEVSK